LEWELRMDADGRGFFHHKDTKTQRFSMDFPHPNPPPEGEGIIQIPPHRWPSCICGVFGTGTAWTPSLPMFGR